MRIALYQPDIPQNLGAILRLSACFGVGIDVIEPCGFPLDDRRIRRVAMDYGGEVSLARHASWARFCEGKPAASRRVLLSTKTDLSYTNFTFKPDDILLMGRESAGVPDSVHQEVEAVITIPMAVGVRSLNVAMAAAIVLGEAVRQCGK